MSKHHEDAFRELATGYFRGRITRRRFIEQAAKLGISAALLSRMLPATYAAGENLVDSSPEAPNESPITKERIEFLKTKPYKGTTINVLVLKATVGDCLKYHAPKWSEATGGHVNVAEVPIDTLHQQIFSDLSTGLGRYDTYMTGAWFYGDFFVPTTPYIVEIDKFLADPRYPYWDPDQWLPSMRKLYEWNGKLYGVLFDVKAAEAATPELAQERANSLKDQLILDMHTHFLRDDTPHYDFSRHAQSCGAGRLEQGACYQGADAR